MILVSQCLLGEKCKYNGGDNYHKQLVSFLEDKDYMGLCPEVMAGLGVPRQPVECLGDKVITEDGKDMTAIYLLGVEKVMERIATLPISLAILQSRSPTCGVCQIYDGSFQKRLIRGKGLLAKRLEQANIPLLDIKEWEKWQRSNL